MYPRTVPIYHVYVSPSTSSYIGVDSTNVVSGGIVSTIVTSVAVPAPVFEYVSVYVIVSPGSAYSTLAVFENSIVGPVTRTSTLSQTSSRYPPVESVKLR